MVKVMRTGERWLAFFLLFAEAVLSLEATTFSQEKKKDGLSYEISVSAVTVAVTVQDRGGRYIDGLTQKDFTVYENDIRKDITYFLHDFKAPLSLTVLLDVSGSMGLLDKYVEARDALQSFAASGLDPRDEVSLLIFADGDVEVASKFSTDKSDFIWKLSRTEPYGQTALNDAVAVSPEFASRGKNEKRALLLITDGVENDSRLSPEAAIEIARKVDVPIYAIGYKIPMSEEYLCRHERRPGLTPLGIIDTLERFSWATGGKGYFLSRPDELATTLKEIKKELSHQYLIGYTSYKDTKTEYGKIRVTTSKKRYLVRTRKER
jgi:Ca-activated chloride channel family protein